MPLSISVTGWFFFFLLPLLSLYNRDLVLQEYSTEWHHVLSKVYVSISCTISSGLVVREESGYQKSAAVLQSIKESAVTDSNSSSKKKGFKPQCPGFLRPLGKETTCQQRGKRRQVWSIWSTYITIRNVRDQATRKTKTGSSYLKGCMELYISWDWETGRPPLSPSWAWACKDVWREMGICWAAAACRRNQDDWEVTKTTRNSLRLLEIHQLPLSVNVPWQWPTLHLHPALASLHRTAAHC